MDREKLAASIALYAIFCFLLFAGIAVIYRSEIIYNQSVDISDSMLKHSAYKSTVSPSYSTVRDGYSQALSFFTLAFGALIAILLFPRLQTLSISPAGVAVTLKDLQQNVNNLLMQGNSLQSTSAGVGGIKGLEYINDIEAPNKRASSKNTDKKSDPLKGKWGGLAEGNGRKISAVVKRGNDPGYYHVRVIVESTDTAKPLCGVVNFHLHPTFSNANPAIAVDNGKAILDLWKVYGPFTIGADMDDKATKLELNLQDVSSKPPGF